MNSPRTTKQRRTKAAASSADPGRRRLLCLMLLAAAGPGLVASAAAAHLTPTPAQALGPFYPPSPDPRAGNDLATNNGKGRAEGEPLRVFGRVLDRHGRPQPEVLIEIWQTNAFGRYHHPDDDRPAPFDPNFRGYGRELSHPDGSYEFRTVLPVAYPGRTPHIHFKLSHMGRTLLVTQMYLPGEAGKGNERDALFTRVRDPAARAQLVGVAVPGVGERRLRFDIVLDAPVRRE